MFFFVIKPYIKFTQFEMGLFVRRKDRQLDGFMLLKPMNEWTIPLKDAASLLRNVLAGSFAALTLLSQTD